MQALRSIGAAAIPACLRGLRDERWYVRLGAAQALRLYGPEAGAAVPALIEALEDRNGQVRSAAGFTLGNMSGEAERAIPALIEGLKHPEPLTRIAFAHALAKLAPGNGDAVATLIESLTYEDPEFRAFIRERGRAWKAVATLMEGEVLSAGGHATAWDGRGQAGRLAPAGIYLVRLEAGGRTWSGRIVRLE